jgi:hypothetical protein
MVQWLPNKFEVLSSNSSIAKRKKESRVSQRYSPIFMKTIFTVVKRQTQPLDAHDR